MRLNQWIKSTYSGASANCVETCLRAPGSALVDFRDTQNRDAGHLSFTSEEWSALLGGLRSESR